MDRTCVSTGRSPETSGPSSPECTDPNVGDRRGGNPPPRTGFLRARLLRPAGRHAMVVAHFFESGQRRRLRWGRVESAPANGRRSSAGQHRVHSCDRRKGLGGANVGSARASRVPHSVSRHCPRRQLEAEYARRKVESSFWSGGWIAAQLRPPGTGCSPANGTPEELRRLARPCVLSIALPLRFYYDFTETSAKNLWGAYASNVIRTY